MTDTNVSTGLTVQQWDSRFFREYISENRFKPVMGQDPNSVIQVKEDLTKAKGDSITFALINKLSGTGVTGSATLEGNEEDLASRSHKVTVDKIRNAVRVAEVDEQFSAISLRDGAREALKDWIMEKTRDEIIRAFMSINGVTYADATQTQRDVWITDNADRVLFGATNSNLVAGDQSASLANVDASGDKLTAARLSLMKRIALTASPKVRPIRTARDERWYICYVSPFAMRDLRDDAVIQQAQREAMPRAQDNPLFSGGDIFWEGIVVKEIDDIPTTLEGASSAQIAPVFLCGAQAVGIGWAKRTNSVIETFDYGDKHGVAIEEIRGIEKLTFGSGAGDTDDLKDNGLVTGWFSAAADA